MTIKGIDINTSPAGGWRLEVAGKTLNYACIQQLAIVAKQHGEQGTTKEIVQRIVAHTLPFIPQTGIFGVIPDGYEAAWNKNVYVLLGRYGDILQLLPILKYESDRIGEPVYLVVAKEFFNLLDGVDYVCPIQWDGSFKQANEAARWIQKKMPSYRVIDCSVYAQDMKHQPKGWSFDRDIWINSRIQLPPHSLPLVFNKRDAEREKKLVTKYIKKGRTVIVSLSGNSSPFKEGSRLKEQLSSLCPKVNFVDISNVESERLYDLLGLYDEADVLIATDSSPLHLAAASKIKTVALVTDENTPWHMSSWKPHHTLRVPYTQALKRVEEIAQVCNGTHKEPKIIYVTSQSPTSDEKTLQRVARAKESLSSETDLSGGRWSACNFHATRDGTSIGDNQVPFIRDMIDAAIVQSDDEDIVVLLNADICVTSGITGKIIDAVTAHGSAYASRWDFKSVGRHALNEVEVRRGTKYPGADLFAMTKAWWRKFNHDFPDMLLGREAWDMILRDLMRFSGGIELHQVIYHEMHESLWLKQRNCAGNQHNNKLAREWLDSHGTTWN